MDITAAIQQARTLIQTGLRHPHYDRCVKYAKEYAAHITGEGIEEYLKRYTPRESPEMFKQRVALTNAINPAVSNSLMKPFYKISRNNNIVKKYDFGDKKLNYKVDIMVNDFNGDNIDNTEGLDNWLKTRFLELTFSDPNAFIVLEWDAAEPNEIIKPRPFEVGSAEAYNYEYRGAELQWLFVCNKVKINKQEGGKVKAVDGVKYTLYAKGVSIVFEEVDKTYIYNFIREDTNADEEAVLEQLGEKYFLLRRYFTNLNYVPAFRVGYNRDLSTGGATFVSPFNPALPYLRKALKVTSELDLTMTAHVFPQKMQYVQKCSGESPTEPCNNGNCVTTQEPCKACQGKGYKTITTAQEAIYLPLPESKEDFLPLNDLLIYKSPPIDIIEFQKKYLQDLKNDTHLAVYNSNMFVTSEAQFAKTATEVDLNMEGVYDTLMPFAEKYSKVWKLIVYTCAALGGYDLKANDFELLHNFPSDFKLKTMGMLLSELKNVNETNAPSFIRDLINCDLAEIVFNGDTEALRRFQVRHQFFPFNGKNAEEIGLLIASQYVPEDTKVLYSNFDIIFSSAETAHVDFYFLPQTEQKKIIKEEIQKLREELVSSNTDRIPLPEVLIDEEEEDTDNQEA